ncbi:TPM domain-containing protein [Candidatus Falkowbacteria bacterium]|nr:MAG: TPM domain-containing protein [Candidatus Falkowbacteria bacterium]
MKRIIVICFALLIFIINVQQVFAKKDCSEMPSKPNPLRAVNDFANIIDDKIEQNIEQKLRDYYNTTTIALIVVTVNSLDGKADDSYAQDLFDCWGPGGKNNAGIIFLVAPKERKTRIHTGYGIEGDLTDAQSKKIIEKNIIPYFKKSDYSSGILNGVENILAVTGPQSMEQRKEAVRIREEESRKVKKQIFDVVINIGIGIILIIGLFYLSRFMLSFLRKKKLSNQLLKSLENQTEQIIQARKVISDLCENTKTAPKWVQEEATEHMEQANQKLLEASRILEKAKGSVKEAPDQVYGFLLKARTLIHKAENNFIKVDKDLRIKVNKFAQAAPVKAEKAVQILEKNLCETLELTNQGFRFNEAVTNQNDLKKKFEETAKNLGNKEYDHIICRESDIIASKSNELFSDIKEVVLKKKEIHQNLDSLLKVAKDHYSSFEKYVKEVDHLKKQYPENVWKKLETDLLRLTVKLHPEKIKVLKNEIEDLNNMKNQKFHLAASKFNNFQELINDVEKVYSEINAVSSQQEKSKKDFFSEYKKTETAVNSALSKIKDSDVSGETKQIAKKAAIKLNETAVESSTSIVDWFFLITLLKSTCSLAEDAFKKAQNDIDDAERRRSRERDDEAESRRNSYSNSDTSFSFSSDSDFGGFGGGMSGGGGASGSW